MKRFILVALGASYIMAQPAAAEPIAVWTVLAHFSNGGLLSTDCDVITKNIKASRYYAYARLAFYIESTQVPGTIPLYSFTGFDSYLYTVSKDAGGDKRWTPTGQLGFISLNPGPGLQDLFEYEYKGSNVHEFTTDYEEQKDIRENHQGGPDPGHGYTLPWGLVGRVPKVGKIVCDPRVLPRPGGPHPSPGHQPIPAPGCYPNQCGNPPDPLPPPPPENPLQIPIPGG